jgi:ribokinase
MPRIIVAASMNMDIAAYTPHLPARGETVLGTKSAYSPGGKGLNQAVAARRLGAGVAVLGALGDDGNGDAVHAFLTQEDIDLTGVQRVAGVATGLALILVDERSDNAIVVIPGANMAWPAETSARGRIGAGDFVAATLEIADDEIVRVLSRARAAGASTILNPAPARTTRADVLALADQIILNEVELPAILGRPVDAGDLASVGTAARALAAGRQVVVVTLGAAGAVVATADRSWHVPPQPVAAVDTAAAGDCFIGAWMAALAAGADYGAAAELATRAAALSVTRQGTAVSLPYRSEVSGF